MYRRPDNTPPLSLEEMLESVQFTGKGFKEWAPKIQFDETVVLDWDGQPRAVPKTIILTQVINHATEHRSQIMSILTQLGIQPPDLDGWTYLDKLEA